MNKIITRTAATVAAIMLSTSAFATEVENQDSQDYKVNVWEQNDKGIFATATIPAGKSMKVCKDSCVVTLDGANNESILSDHKDVKLIIKDKKLKPRG